MLVMGVPPYHRKIKIMYILILFAFAHIQTIQSSVYTDKIFSKFGSYDSVQKKFFLTENNLTDLVGAVLTGDYYEPQGNYCEASNCTEQVSVVNH